MEVQFWDDYDNYSLEEGKITEEVCDAVIKDIEKNSYLFTGEHHQEHSKCAPVMSDGKIRRFSRREFAYLMAKAHGETEKYSYANYMEMIFIKKEYLKFPK